MIMKQEDTKFLRFSVSYDMPQIREGVLGLCPLSEPSKIANYKMRLKPSKKWKSDG